MIFIVAYLITRIEHFTFQDDSIYKYKKKKARSQPNRDNYYLISCFDNYCPEVVPSRPFRWLIWWLHFALFLYVSQEIVSVNLVFESTLFSFNFFFISDVTLCLNKTSRLVVYHWKYDFCYSTAWMLVTETERGTKKYDIIHTTPMMMLFYKRSTFWTRPVRNAIRSKWNHYVKIHMCNHKRMVTQSVFYLRSVSAKFITNKKGLL